LKGGINKKRDKIFRKIRRRELNQWNLVVPLSIINAFSQAQYKQLNMGMYHSTLN
jgi:hypothetical protein